jgi:hypothetical protein
MESLSGDASMHVTQRQKNLFVTNSFRASLVNFVSGLLVDATIVLSSRERVRSEIRDRIKGVRFEGCRWRTDETASQRLGSTLDPIQMLQTQEVNTPSLKTAYVLPWESFVRMLTCKKWRDWAGGKDKHGRGQEG